MNSAVEQGIRAYLSAQLTGSNTTIGTGDEAITVLACTINGKSVSMHCNITGESMPRDRSWIIVGVPPIPRLVGALHQATIAIAISTPTNVSGVTDADHRAIVAAVRACFPDMPTLYQKLAKAVGAPAIAIAQAALDAGLAKVAACATALSTAASVTISDTSPWFMDSTRDGVTKDLSRWESITVLQIAVQEQ